MKLISLDTCDSEANLQYFNASYCTPTYTSRSGSSATTEDLNPYFPQWEFKLQRRFMACEIPDISNCSESTQSDNEDTVEVPPQVYENNSGSQEIVESLSFKKCMGELEEDFRYYW
uniref:Uncharacterized protein n=1 Tax=Panagrolaimus superbus TaxID=310955 RepID=A0A914XWB3_9BILA